MEKRINNAQDSLTKTDFNILNYLNENKVKIQEMSIHEISEQAFVSSASIVRLAKKLAFSGFSEMKFSIKSELNNNSEDFKSSISLFEQDIQDTLNLVSDQNLQPICEEIKNSKRILSFGTDWGEKMAAESLERNFLACNIFIHQIPSITELLWTFEKMTEDDMIILLSYSGDNPTLRRIIPLLKAKNIPVLSITPLSGNYLSSNSKHRLYYKATQLERKNSNETEYNFFTSLNITAEFFFRYYHDNYYL